MARETKEPDWAKDDTGHLTSAPAAGGAGFSSSAAEIFRLPPLLSSSDPDIAPSQIAYSGKQGALVAALASAGSAEARIKLICGPDADQRSLFHWASAGGHDELLKTLLASAREAGLGHEQIVTVLNRGDEAGMTPLSSAAAAGSVSCIDILLAYGADANTSNKGGQLPLHYHKGRAAVVAALLPVTRDINAADKAGATALHRAAGPGFLATVEALLAGGARIGCRDRFGNTPLHLAAEEARLDVVRCLLDHGADPKIRNADGKDCTAVVGDGVVRARVEALVRAATSK